ncbi:MAG: hypothetical protein VBE63_23515 [Lamprobacter sp.]|uniref:hypothetical protein n=1 Tax=Lamprobacter sp. TaxID=3100796 RepID=UPI002B256DC9|nr:hypothetical protein [Lamprobacter sp.]MEA3642885.1 hypothetical protein [Lamprobacter sp.]
MAAVPPAAVPPANLDECGTFAEWFSHPTNDHFDGTNLVTVADPATWNAATVGYTVFNMADGVPLAFVGLFYDGAHLNTGTTRLLMFPKTFPSTLRGATPYDRRVYAFVDEVGGGTAPTVQFPVDAFTLATNNATVVPLDPNDLVTDMNAHANELNVRLVAAAGTTQDVYCTRLTWVPPRYVSLLIGRRLTPRQAALSILPVIVNDGVYAQVTPFANWLMMATYPDAINPTPSLMLAADVTAPVPNSHFTEWRQQSLNRILPAVSGLLGGGAGPTSRIANIMGDLLQVQREVRNDATAARTAAAAPKSVADFFGDSTTDKLMALCQVHAAHALPEIWISLAAANGKREREVIESRLRVTATALGDPELAPVITPDLAKKIVSVRLEGSNLDDFSDGVNPFLMVIQDYTSPGSEKQYFDAISLAADYDTLVGGTAAADLADITKMRTAIKVQIPTNFVTMRLMLQAFTVLLATLLEETHEVVQQLSRFTTQFLNKEPFYVSRLQNVDPKYGPARLLRYVQLHVRAYFADTLGAATPAVAAAVPTPQFLDRLRDMKVGDMSWLPHLPQRYYSTVTPKSEPRVEPEDKPGKAPKKEEGGTKRKAVRNTQMDARFEDFKTGISNSKFNDVIKKVGAPPTVKRGGDDIAMCVSYHLRGTCFESCSRKADHGPHSKDENDQLYAWCKKAFE